MLRGPRAQLIFLAGGFEFILTSYQWLFITGNDCAKFKGIGQITEGGIINDVDHGFMLTACDGKEQGIDDTFHVKIWLTIDGGTTYDNMMDTDDSLYNGTDIGGENIKKKKKQKKKKKKKKKKNKKKKKIKQPKEKKTKNLFLS